MKNQTGVRLLASWYGIVQSGGVTVSSFFANYIFWLRVQKVNTAPWTIAVTELRVHDMYRGVDTLAKSTMICMKH